MNKIFHLVILLTLFASCGLANAASEAEYKKLAKTWQLNADGSQEYRYQMELTLFTHTAMNGKYGESFVVYNPQFQELKINSSYTKQKDGTIVETPSNAFVEVLPRNAANAPDYNHLREMVIVHTGLELGATIYLDYTLKTKAGYLPALDVFEKIQQTSPVREYTIEMRTPENKDLSYTLTYKNASPKTKVVNGVRHTSWTLRNIPANSKADFVTLANGDVPYLAATTFPSTQKALANLQKQFDTNESAVLKTLAAQLTKGKETKSDKIQAIWRYVNRQIDLCPLTLEQTGYRIRSVDKVLHSVYGTEAEKLNLLLALLKTAGINASPVADYPVALQSGLGLKAIRRLHVAVDGTSCLLNVKDLSRPSGAALGLTSLCNFSDGKSFQFPESLGDKIVGDYDIQLDTLSMVSKVHERVEDGLLSYFENGKMEKTNKSYLEVHDKYTMIVLPENSHGISHLRYSRLNSRRNVNMIIPRIVDETYTYMIKCSEKMQMRTPEQDVQITNSAGRMVSSIQKTDNGIKVVRSLKLNKQIYTPKEYKDVRDLLIAWNDRNSKTLLFLMK